MRPDALPLLNLVRRLCEEQDTLTMCPDCGLVLQEVEMAAHDCVLDPRHAEILRRAVEEQAGTKAHQRAKGYCVR